MSGFKAAIDKDKIVWLRGPKNEYLFQGKLKSGWSVIIGRSLEYEGRLAVAMCRNRGSDGFEGIPAFTIDNLAKIEARCTAPWLLILGSEHECAALQEAGTITPENFARYALAAGVRA